MILYQGNEGKVVTIQTSNGNYNRYPVKTHFITVGEDYLTIIRDYILPHYQPGDILSISEKIISLCQRDIIEKKDIIISRLARFLAPFAGTSATGIGVNNVYKMQVAINLCGRMKILFAAAIGGICKLFGKRGVFYRIAGEEISGLDGFYSQHFEEYSDFGILLPSNPQNVCRRIKEEFGISCIIADANDFGASVLASSEDIDLDPAFFSEVLQDNPTGNGTQLTPFLLIRRTKQPG